ncbi:hypothetical protein [Cesiribacter sp. SM1]|uniref:hypothetical protein n=1 Tax=Cesiribacter sp. SM1 TaxID=2861196 RepID=UPI001CD6E02B|nr:hypothetical protein [Cesiribacter sp. SM1]
MKSFTLTLIFSVLAFTPLLAQSTTRVTVEDNNIEYALKDHLYRFPSFTNGKVFLPNGRFNTAKLNLNMLYDQMQFIDDKKDTLTILSPEQLHHVEIDGKTFIYHNEGFLEVIENYETVSLAVSRKLKIADRQQEGAYGSKSSTASISNIGSAFTDKLRYNPSVYEDLLVNISEEFYLIDEEWKISPLNKKNVLRAFPERKNEISTFLKENRTNFKKESSVKELMKIAAQ